VTGGFDNPATAQNGRPEFDSVNSDDDLRNACTKTFSSSAERGGILEWLRIEHKVVALLAKMRDQYAEMKADAQIRCHSISSSAY
jgi:hypothetical protein